MNAMKPQPGVWGIDLGQCGLKALRLQEIDGQLVATAFDYVEHPKILSQPDAEPDQLTREALEKFLSRNNLRGDTVAISVPGQSGLARFVKLPPVEEKKIADIVRFEAKQQIPFNLEEVVWDYQKIGAGTVTDGFAMDTEIGLFAMKRDMVSKYLQHFKDVNVEVHVIQMAPLALCNYAAYDLLKKENALTTPPPPTSEGAEGTDGTEGTEEKKEEDGCVVILDIGTDSSNLVITDGDKIIWQRPIPLGGNHFTRALTKDLKLTFAKAEHLKRNATKSPDLKKILSSLKPVLNDFVSEVQRSLGYFTNTHRDAQITHMMGLGNAFRLPGLQRFLEEKLGLQVRKLQKLDRLSGDAVVTSQVYTENIMTFAVAYGLALQAMKRTRLQTNLLPPEIRTERLIKAKKPWAVAAAAALLVALGGLMASYWLYYRPYNTPEVAEAIKKVEDAKTKAANAQSQFTAAKAKADSEEKSVHSIVAGQGEFLNWLEFMSFVSKTIPQPDGKNLPTDRARTDFWLPSAKSKKEGMSGAMAFEAYKKRLREPKQAPIPVAPEVPNPGNPSKGGVPGRPPMGQPAVETPSEDLGPEMDDLIQVDLESIDARYTDLHSFWANVQKDLSSHRSDMRPQSQYDKFPEGKGWVVELRGYTFHRKENRFVMEAFVDNIAHHGIPDLDKPAAPPPGPGPQTNPPPVTSPKPPAGQPPAPPAKPAPPAGKHGSHDLGPVVNRVSHVVLYKTRVDTTNDTHTFGLINTGVLDSLLSGGPNPGMGDQGNPPGGPPGSGPQQDPRKGGSRGGSHNWTPLAASSTPPTPGFSRPGNMPVEKTPPAPPAGSLAHQRTEFIIVFIWQEPNPSAELFNQAQPAQPAPGGQPKPGPGGPGKPGPGGPAKPPTTPPGPAAKPPGTE
jgi:type IV pilus assembly protein PilM